MNDKEYEEMKSSQDRFHEKAMNIPGVHGTSVGLKTVNGELTDKFAICIHVSHKKALNEIPVNERIPDHVDGFPTDVIVHEQPKLCVDNLKYRPLEGGIQIMVSPLGGIGEFTIGTLGCFVRDNTTGQALALSNHHVLRHDLMAVGQPTTILEEIGVVVRLALTASVDAGVATISASGVKHKNYIRNIGNVKGSLNITSSDLPCNVRKRGRTTGLTRGQVTGLNGRGRANNGWEYSNQMIITPERGKVFLESGDSGSALVDDDVHVVGLVWGVGSGYGFANQISNVLEELNVEVLTSGMDINVYPEYKKEVVVKLKKLLSKTVRGKVYWDTYRKFEDDFRHMFHSIPELHMLWLNLPHAEIIKEIENSLYDKDYCIPEFVAGLSTAKMFTEMSRVLSVYIKEPALKEQANSFCKLVAGNVGKRFLDVFDGPE